MNSQQAAVVQEPALEAIGVSHRYRRRGPLVLEDVSVSLPRGSIAALIGPNGAGKSTLLRSWMAFERPRRGVLKVMGFDVRTNRMEALSRVGFLSQAVGLYRGLSVEDHVELGVTLRPGFDRHDALSLLDAMRIRTGQRAGELSGGQQAQAALALALATKAAVYLLDEPLASLDPLARQEFLNILAAEVRSRGASVLLASHIVSDVEDVADWLVLLGSGRVALQGPIAKALATHRVEADHQRSQVDDVGSFSGAGGRRLMLRRSIDPALATPTLSELVMGYLAGSRPGAGWQETSATP